MVIRRVLSAAAVAVLGPAAVAVLGPAAVAVLGIVHVVVAVVGLWPAGAAEVLPGPYAAEVLRIVDGDTFEARIRIWLGHDVTSLVRIADFDAAERTRSHCAAERQAAESARAALAELLAGGRVDLAKIRFGKYARRVVATVRLPDGTEVAAALTATGHHSGGRVFCPSPW